MVTTFYIYKDVPNTNGRYRAYIDGRIYDKLKNKFLEPRIDKAGYCNASISYTNKKGTKLWHRIIAQTFIPNTNNKPQINHKDANKENNCVDNLEWVTSQENMSHVKHNRLNPRTKWCCIVDDDGVIIKIEHGINILSQSQFVNFSDIYHCCTGRAHSHNGIKYRFYDADNHNYKKTKFDKNKIKIKGKYNREFKCNETGQVFSSQESASTCLNIKQCHISNYLNGKRTMSINGYTFEYI